MPVVSARDIHKAYGPQTLLSGVSFTVRTGERVGLLGANGAGKSTLLRLLAGLETPDSGVIETRRGARIRYLAQEPVLDPEATAAQIVERGLVEWHQKTSRHHEISALLDHAAPDAMSNLLHEQGELAEAIEHLGGWSRDRVGIELLTHLGVTEVDRPVGTMSGGEKRRVALAELLVSEPSLAILDEPTNHLDVDAIEWLEEYLASTFNGAVLLVTHDRYVLDAVAERVLELEGGAVTQFTGGYAGYLEQKAEMLAHGERVEQNRLNLLRREKAWLERGAKARTTKQKARVKRAEALLDTTARREAERVDLSGFDGGSPRLGKTILDLESVRLDVPGKCLVRDLTLRLVKGERVGILGPNGSGKTSLLKLVSGELQAASGRVVLGANTHVVYFDQARSNLNDAWSVFDNVAEREGADRGHSEAVRIGEQVLEMRTYLEQFLFDGSKQRQKVGALSGGERARVALAKALKTGANLLLLDEPTNDLDVSTLASLEELLISWPGCALVVSHDRYFLDRIATGTLVFEGEGRVTQYQGGYATYRSLKAQADLAEAERRPSAAPPPKGSASDGARKTSPPAPSSLKPLTFAERKELDGILDEIAKLETSVAELETQLGDPALYANGAAEAEKVRDTHGRQSSRLADRTLRWEALEARRDVRK